MNHTLILISGVPATGKSTYGQWLASTLSVPLISYDNMKAKVVSLQEMYKSNEQKALLEILPYTLFIFLLEEIMKTSSLVIADYLFCENMKPLLDEMISKYAYNTINVHFDADEKICYERFIERNEREVSAQNIRPVNITLEQFRMGTLQNKNFRYGKNIIEVNTNDFDHFSKEDILTQVLAYVNMHCL